MPTCYLIKLSVAQRLYGKYFHVSALLNVLLPPFKHLQNTTSFKLRMLIMEFKELWEL